MIYLIGFLSSFFFIPAEFDAVIAHDLHLSKTEIRYKPDQQSIQFTVHLFIDDLENALSLYGAKDLNLCTEKESVEAENWLEAYIQKKLLVAINDQTVNLQFIGKEMSEDMMGIWCYFEISAIDEFNILEIDNQLMHDLFDDQKNIMAFYQDSKNLSFDFYDNKRTILSISVD